MNALTGDSVQGGGKIGRPIVARLLETTLFHVTILTRQNATSNPDFPSAATVRAVDYNSLASLEAALRGQDAVVSAMAFEAIHEQKNIVDAAANVGVRRIVPSEYGNDTLNPKLATVPIYQPKIAIREQCERLAAEKPPFSWTTVQNASFLAPDWTLDFIVDVKDRGCDVKDGGNVLFCATTYTDIAQAIVGILTHLEETANRPVRISSVNTTQNEIIAIAKELGAVDGWHITHSRTEDLEAEARRRWSEGDHSEEVIAMFINRAFIGDGWGGYFPERDNELLGIKGLQREGLKNIVKLAMER